MFLFCVGVSYVGRLFISSVYRSISYQSMAVVVAQLSANGPVSVFFYLLLVRKHDGLTEPGELQLNAGSLLQDDMINPFINHMSSW